MKYHVVTKGNREYILDAEPLINTDSDFINFTLPIVEGAPNVYPEGTIIAIPMTEVIALLFCPEDGEAPYGQTVKLKSV